MRRGAALTGGVKPRQDKDFCEGLGSISAPTESANASKLSSASVYQSSVLSVTPRARRCKKKCSLAENWKAGCRGLAKTVVGRVPRASILLFWQR